MYKKIQIGISNEHIFSAARIEKTYRVIGVLYILFWRLNHPHAVRFTEKAHLSPSPSPSPSPHLSPQHAAHPHAQFLDADASTARRLAAPRTAQAIHRSSIRPHLPSVSTLHPFLCSPRCQEIHGRVDLSHPGLRLTSACGPVPLCVLGHLISLVASPRRRVLCA